MKKYFAFIFAACSVLAYTSELPVNNKYEKEVEIYNGYARIYEERDMEKTDIPAWHILKDLPVTLETDGMVFDNIDLAEIRYQKVNQNYGLNQLVGKIIEIENNRGETKEYKLLGINEGFYVMDIETETYSILYDVKRVSFKDKVVFMSLPEVSILAKSGDDNKIGIGYTANGIKWSASYNLFVKGETVKLHCFAQIDNQADIEFKNSRIKLIAGNVKKNSPVLLYKSDMAMSRAATPEIEQGQFSDYYSFALTESRDIEKNIETRFTLFTKENIPYQKYYEISQGSKNASVAYEFMNDEKAGEFVCPEGNVKVYDTIKGKSKFVGEDTIGNIPVNGKIKLNTGNSFDITSEFREKESKNIQNGYEKEIEYTIKSNNKDKAAVRVNIYLPAGAEVVSFTDKYQRESSTLAIVPVTLSKNETKTVRLRYKVMYK